MEEQIAESVLLDVFGQIKGDFGKQRPFINIDDFKKAVIRYEPSSLKNLIEARALGGPGLRDFNNTVESLFCNICESVSPVNEPNLSSKQVNDFDSRTLAP